MVAIACPWCEGDTPIALDQLRSLDAPWTCPACQTSVELVTDAEDAPFALAA